MTVREPMIVAMGGGGFSMEPDNPLLDHFVLTCAARARTRVCLLPTASGDSADYTWRFYAEFTKLGTDPCHLHLFDRKIADLRSFVLGCDVVYVGGGNTANMLAVWRAHGVDEVLREAWAEGIVMAGVSAGSNCWFQGSLTDAFGDGYAPLRDGLGLVAGSTTPHYDGEPGRREAYLGAIASGGLQPGLALDDGAAAVFVGEDAQFCEIVTSRATARGYRVDCESQDPVEAELEARYLGAAEVPA